VRRLTPAEIPALQEREGARPEMVARYLNITARLVVQWERGQKRLQGVSVKLVPLIARHGLAAAA
jgi:DNA-binding transcriptional regulator YiaG